MRRVIENMPFYQKDTPRKYHYGLRFFTDEETSLYADRLILIMVRNPWDWYVSRYTYWVNFRRKVKDHKHILHDLWPAGEDLGFIEFTERLVLDEFGNARQNREYEHLSMKIPTKIFGDMRRLDIGFLTWHYVDLLHPKAVLNATVEDVEEVFNRSGVEWIQLESVDEDFKAACKKTGLPPDPAWFPEGRVNTSKRDRNYRAYYKDRQDLIDEIGRKERYIVEKFGYEY